MRILRPAEKATALLSGQQYLTVSSVLPVVTSLCSLADTEANRLAVESKDSLSTFASVISREITQKFKLSPIDTHSVRCVAAGLDPRSRSQAFLPADSRQTMQEEVLQRCTPLLASEPEPAAKRVPPSDDAINLFFGAASDEEACQSAQLQNEVASFFSEVAAPSSTQPLKWWCANSDRFPHLSKLAKSVLCIPATSVPSERVFSAAGHIVSKLRAALSPENVDALIFLQQNGALRRNVSASVALSLPHSPVPPQLDEVLDEELADVPALPALD